MKKIPVKPKKKSARKQEITELLDPGAQRKMTRAAENHLIDLEELAEERYQWAIALKREQPEDLQVAINRMVAHMAHMAGPPKFTYEGVNWNVDFNRLNSIQMKSHTWIAMRLLVASAEWGNNIGNFKAPKDSCIRCGKSIKPRKKGRK